tara:strand:+ start:1029 stop:2006 length:978 start_codon:yes stop_codon:yes gene_type:complete
MKMNKTGNMRSIADSAWISTMSEARAKSRTDEDVDRVVSFLAEHMHTSPFESVTLSFVESKEDYASNANGDLVSLLKNKYSKSSCFKDGMSVTIDLLNFSKHSYYNSFKNDLWKIFESEEPRLAEIIKLFNFSKKEKAPEDATKLFESEIEVELISLHKGLSKKEARATWRVKCPLSIAVQILRHRTASFNMVSGRYKTIRQEVVGIPSDIIEILDLADCKDSENKLGCLVDEIMSRMDASKETYLKTMKELKRCKDNSSITNADYKRMREYVRFVLPEGRLTELYITMYLDDLDNFIMLRNSAHAQVEHIAVAQLMKRTLENEI